ncbi:MAG: beta-lactamase family protein [Chloroflexi bacterium]|nr:beta-lactamase family protein [Chloroflexota bacterium]
MADTGAIDEALAAGVERGDAPGVVALAATDDGLMYEGAFGRRGVDDERPMTLDSVFWIASMTKAITSVAAMQLVEQGRVGLDQPVVGHVPAIADVRVLDGFDRAGAPRLRPARRPITLRHLLTHTAGFGYDIWSADICRYQEISDIPNIIECRDVCLYTPLLADPGQRWIYGISVDWAGKLVEAVSGRSLEAYFREHLFDPLGMADTGFLLSPARRARRASMHQRQADGSFKVISHDVPQQPEFFMGGGGLYSTGPDYLRFVRMLLGEGQLDGARVLQAESVREMGQNQIGELQVEPLRTAIPSSSNDADFFPGMRQQWGLGFLLNTEESPKGRAPYSLAWGGLANTYFWVDPSRKIAGVLMTQVLPFVDAGVIDLYSRFESGLYSARLAPA